MDLEIKTADQLTDSVLEARWAARRTERHREIFQGVLRTLVARPGPVPVAAITAAFPGRPASAVREALVGLDAEDLLLLRGDRIELAYPLSGVPTPFAIGLPDGGERYACCAIDALGIAPMLGARIVIRSGCHHCGEPLAFSAGPDGPEPEAGGIMVWVAARDPGERRIATSLWTNLNFFRSEDHLRAWHDKHPGVAGAGAFLAQAFELGRRIFGGLLTGE